MPRPQHVPDRAAVLDREALGARAAAASGLAPAVAIVRDALAAGRAEIARRMAAHPGRGREFAHARAFLMDGALHVLAQCARVASPGPGALTLVAVGGYGRGELAPFSDIDLMFLTPAAPTPAATAVIETVLRALWDFGLKVGHATRTPDELIRAAKDDLTIRTSLVEARYLWGDRALFDLAFARFRREVASDGGKARFVAEKLAERNARHQRMGDSRYVVEPNLKEGKGGLRDLHTLFWIGKFVHKTDRVDDLVKVGLLTEPELRQFKRADDFFWAVRAHLHDLAGRAEDRLTFDLQPEVARRLRYADRPGRSAVERFMRHYYLHARHVGALTGVFLAQLEEQFGARSWLPRITRRPALVAGFQVTKGRVGVPGDGFFRADPVRLIELFHIAEKDALDIDPAALRLARRDAPLIDERVRADPRANALFMDVLTSPRDPEKVLRWMNEAGVFGRFIPDFGRVVAQSQFDMYHHYTVDEHTIRAIGLLSRIESGALSAEYELASALAHKAASRRVLYVAALLHDIAKGRGRDHSVEGAEIAHRLGPRLGLTPGETETVAWLVRQHLLMSATAFKRDLTDPKTVADFAAVVGSPERLRLLFVLTTVDISAVGPGVWNPWKAQLLRDLHDKAEELLRLGHKERGREEAVAAKQAALARALGWPAERFAAHAARLEDAYWVAEPADVLAADARLMAEVDGDETAPRARALPDPARGATLVAVYAHDHPGLFGELAGAIALGGASILDARIHTTRDGRAVDNFVVTDPLGRPFDEPRRLRRLERCVEDVLAGRVCLVDTLAAKPPPRPRAEAFGAEPIVTVSNKASNRFTVAEVTALDRPALLHALTAALFAAGATIRSAHIATYGERAVDVFYLTGLDGAKIVEPGRLAAIETALAGAARPVETRRAA